MTFLMRSQCASMYLKRPYVNINGITALTKIPPHALSESIITMLTFLANPSKLVILESEWFRCNAMRMSLEKLWLVYSICHSDAMIKDF